MELFFDVLKKCSKTYLWKYKIMEDYLFIYLFIYLFYEVVLGIIMYGIKQSNLKASLGFYRALIVLQMEPELSKSTKIYFLEVAIK